MKKFFALSTLPFLFNLLACKDQPEQIPAYLHIEPFEVNAQGGEAWQKIIFGWVYVNTELLGAYSFPAEVPVLAEGEAEVVVFPGINENGIAATPNIYPFLTRFDKTVNLVPAQTTNIQPTTRYDDAAKTVWSDEGTFDGSTLVFDNHDADNVRNLEFVTTGAFYGKSARMNVDKDHVIMQAGTEWVPSLPTNSGQQTWLELHYKNEAVFELWIEGRGGADNSAQAIFQFKPIGTWNKIYLNLTDYLSTTKNNEYRLDFRLSLPKDEAGNYSQDSADVLFDNLKIVYF